MIDLSYFTEVEVSQILFAGDTKFLISDIKDLIRHHIEDILNDTVLPVPDNKIGRLYLERALESKQKFVVNEIIWELQKLL